MSQPGKNQPARPPEGSLAQYLTARSDLPNFVISNRLVSQQYGTNLMFHFKILHLIYSIRKQLWLSWTS